MNARTLALRFSLTVLAPLLAVAGMVILSATGVTPSVRAMPAYAPTEDHLLQTTVIFTSHIYLPIIAKPLDACAPIPGETYGSIVPNSLGTDPAGNHLINLGLRGYAPVAYFKGLISTGPPADPLAPQFTTLFAISRTPGFPNVYALYKWDNTCNCRSDQLVTSPQVSVLGLGTTPGETIHAPDSGYDIGGGYDAMVLYAERTRLTLKYTREDDIVTGYAVYLENVCVEPGLLALYQQLNADGRNHLPVLRGHQALGRAVDDEIRIAVRDSGSSLDPRVRNSWWIGSP